MKKKVLCITIFLFFIAGQTNLFAMRGINSDKKKPAEKSKVKPPLQKAMSEKAAPLKRVSIDKPYVEKKEENFQYCKNPNKRVEILIDFAKSNDIIIGKSKDPIEVDGIKNNVYQLKVSRQHGATCALHALYNCFILEPCFSSSEVTKEFCSDWLSCLNDISEIEDFIESSKKFTDNQTAWLMSTQIQNIIAHYKFRNISSIDGYELLSTEGPVKFEGKSNVYFSGWLLNKPVGYYYGLTTTLGEAERGVLGKESLGHWISLFSIKTSEKEYFWFVMDSMGANYIQDGIVNDLIKAYIYKFLGKSYEPYEKFIQEQHKKIDKEQERKDSISINELILEYENESKTKKESPKLKRQISDTLKLLGRQNSLINLFATKLVDLSEFKHFNVNKNMEEIGKINDFLSQLNNDLQWLIRFRWSNTKPDLKKIDQKELINFINILDRIENCDYAITKEIKERVKSRILKAHKNLIVSVRLSVIKEIEKRSKSKI